MSVGGRIASAAVPLLVMLALVPSGSASGPGGTGNVFASSAPRNVPGELIVRFRRGTTGAERRDTRQDADTSLDHPLTIPRAQLLQVERGQTVPAAVRKLDRDPDVLYAEPNRRFTATAAPSDEFYGELWGLTNTGQVVRGQAGVPGADINVLDAWSVSTGSPSVLVAVTDTGLQRNHPDLADNAWTNPGEEGAKRTNGLDDDGNGFVDDWRGWDFASADNDPADGHGHGTHVSGTIGAAGDNEIGVTGVNQHVSLVGVKVLDDGGSGTTESVAEGFAYAGRIGADVVNASLGGGGTDPLIEDAIDGAPDTLFVVAAGNDSVSVDTHPESPCAEIPANLVCVAATDNRDSLASFSNFGLQSVDLGAPGVSVLSTVPDDGYGRLSGTSMASPHVAGAAALVAAVFPDEGPIGWKYRLLDSVDPDPALSGMTVSGGRLNVGSALGQPSNLAPVARLTGPAAVPRAQEQVLLDSSASSDDGTILSHDWDLDGDGSYETSTGASPVVTTTYDQPGIVDVGVRVRDNRGAPGQQRLSLRVDPAPPDVPVARFSAEPEPVVAGNPLSLDGSASTDDAAVSRYEWDIDGDWSYETDGGASPTLQHTFKKKGVVSVGLRVTDARGNRSETRRRIEVRPALPVAAFDFEPQSPIQHDVVTFDASGSSDGDGKLAHYAWDLDGDGWWDDFGRTVTWRYDSARSVEVTLTINDHEWNYTSLTRTVVVAPGVGLDPGGAPTVSERPGDSDGDGAVEPGEGLVLSQSLRNAGTNQLTGIHGALRSLQPADVTPAAGAANWPDMAAGSEAGQTPSFSAHTYGSMTCGVPAQAEVNVVTDQGRETVPVAIVASGHEGSLFSVPDAGLPYDLPPGWWVYTSAQFPDHTGVRDVDVQVDLSHTNVGDLVIALEPPERGNRIFDDLVTLFDRQGGDGDDLVGTVFDSQAPDSIRDGQAPFTGRFRPIESLSGINGLDAYGSWGIYFENWSTTETAHLTDANVRVTPSTCGDARNPSLPQASISAPYKPPRGKPFTLDASRSSDLDGRIVEYRWDLDGDGRYESRTAGPTTTATFDDVGWHEVAVQVIDDLRGAGEQRTGVDVRASIPPVMDMAYPNFIRVGEPARFDASGSNDPDGKIVAYRWDFDGNGSIDAAGPVVDHTFLEAGEAAVILWIVDDSGEQERGISFPWVHDASDPVPVVAPPYDPGVAPPPWPQYPIIGPDGLANAVLPIRPAPGTAPAPGPAPVPRPALRFNFPGRISITKLAAGLPLTVACDSDCDFAAQLSVSRGVARRLRLVSPGSKGGPVAVGTRRSALLAGVERSLRVRVPVRVRRALSLTHGVAVKLDLSAGGPGGVARVTRPVKISVPRVRQAGAR